MLISFAKLYFDPDPRVEPRSVPGAANQPDFFKSFFCKKKSDKIFLRNISFGSISDRPLKLVISPTQPDSQVSLFLFSPDLVRRGSVACRFSPIHGGVEWQQPPLLFFIFYFVRICPAQVFSFFYAHHRTQQQQQQQCSTQQRQQCSTQQQRSASQRGVFLFVFTQAFSHPGFSAQIFFVNIFPPHPGVRGPQVVFSL